MSRQRLKSFLEQLEREMYGTSKEYRKEADKREMTFFYSATSLKQELMAEFEQRNLLELFNRTEVQSFIATNCNNILAALRARAKSFKSTRGVYIQSNQYSIKVTIAAEKNPKTDSDYINFTKIKELYKESIDGFVLELNEFLKKTYNTKLTKTKAGYYDYEKKQYIREVINTDKEIKYGSDLIEAGHEEGEGILETRMRDAINVAINKNYTTKASREVLESNMDALGIDFGFVRDDTTDTHTIFAQSRVENRKAGFLSADKKRLFQKQLRKAINRLDDKNPIKGLKGSDSIQEFKAKQAEYAAVSQYAKVKGGKVTPKPKKPKATKRKAVASKGQKTSTKTNSSIAKARVPKAKGLKRRKATRRQGPASSPLQLIGLINKELPQTVRKNMKAPFLENRTGRFSESVKVTDVIQTPKGHPSIGYTYQKNPYQVFEMGEGDSRWATPERDPRVLIDRSIREIAIKFAIGRFYTRRV